MATSSAILSDCGLYRYRLERRVQPIGGIPRSMPIAWIMVNPSTADAETDDATIRKVMGFSARWGFSEIIVGNLFAWRATDIKALRTAASPIGPENDEHLASICANAGTIVAAWGSKGKLPETLRKRWIDVTKIIRRYGDPLCLGVAADGHPLHPLMPGYETSTVLWDVPWFPGRPALSSATTDEPSDARIQKGRE